MRKKLFNTFKVKFGKSFKIYHLTENITLKEYNEFPVDRNETGLTASIFGSMELNIGKRLYIELNAIILGLTYSLDTMYTDNPSRTERQKKTGGFDFNMWNEKLLRIGLGFNL